MEQRVQKLTLFNLMQAWCLLAPLFSATLHGLKVGQLSGMAIGLCIGLVLSVALLTAFNLALTRVATLKSNAMLEVSGWALAIGGPIAILATVFCAMHTTQYVASELLGITPPAP